VRTEPEVVAHSPQAGPERDGGVPRGRQLPAYSADALELAVFAFLVATAASVGYLLQPRDRILTWIGWTYGAVLDALALSAFATALALGVVLHRRLLALREANRRLHGLYTLAHIVSSSFEPKEVLSRSVDAMREHLGYRQVVVMLAQGDRLVPAAWAGYRERPPDLRLKEVVSCDPTRAAGNEFKAAQFVPTVEGAWKVTCPILVDERVVGALHVQTPRVRHLVREDLELVESIAVQLQVALRNAFRYAEARELALRDGLTGLLNHAAFHERLQEEVARARRAHQSLALILSDLDDFKAINDTYGHLEGDRLLRAFADLVRRCTRSSDIAARYGGEEFAVVLPGLGAEEAVRVAERIRTASRGCPLMWIGPVPVSITVSLGVAAYPEHGEDPVELLRQADEALYRAKRAGKDCTHVAGPVRREPAVP
jgi:diguanylate cyclase (GGDEF)-like protein